MASAMGGAPGQGPTENHGAEATKEDYSKPTGDYSEFRLILVGKSGVGKSATGNTILCTEAFKSTLTANTTTVKVQRKQGTWNEKSISVIDTPALFDSDELEKSLEEELEKCRQLCRSGLHAILLVIQVRCFMPEDMAVAERIRKIFGDESANHMILLFTRKEDLGGESLAKYLEEATNENLHTLLDSCRRRFCGFNNKAEGIKRDEQVDELMVKVKNIIVENQGKLFVIPEASSSKLTGEDAERRLILVGRSGVGKSATGNTILRTDAFKSILMANTTTKHVQRVQGTWKEKSISVIDTPALFDSNELGKSLEEELEKCREMCRSGLHAFVLVIQVGRFGVEDTAAAKRIQKIFGDESTNHTILLFTYKEDLGGESLAKYLEGATNKNLHTLLDNCQQRFCGFNNKAKGDEQDKQVDELMVKVENIMENRGAYVIPESAKKSNFFSKRPIMTGIIKKFKNKK